MYVSIIITSYNYGDYIERCIRSCLGQDFPKDRFEVIVVDDCSTDRTMEIIEKFKVFPNFRVIANSKNLGVAESSNIGIRAALGRYVVRVDADDYVNEYMVSFMSFYLDTNPDAHCVACDYVLVDSEERVLERKYATEAPVSCGIMYHKDRLVAAGLYNPEFRHREEEELRARMGYRAHHLRIPFYRYRKHGSNKTRQRAYEETKVPEYSDEERASGEMKSPPGSA